MNKKTFLMQFIKNYRYFTLDDITNKIELNRRTIKNYLSDLKQEGIIFDAGYGVYTTLKEEFKIPVISRIETIGRLLKKNFPFTEFIIWDTKQLQSLYQHTQAHHVTFVETDKELMNSFYDCISKKYQKTYIEKKNKNYFVNFPLHLNPVVIRKKISRSPYAGVMATLEKILVDMFIDLETYKYISEDDYWQMWRELISNYRLNIGKIISYSKRRKCFQGLFSQLIDNNILSEVTSATFLNKVAEVIRKNDRN
ncbi:HTH domain-containing protein [bacterium]|nr:HTH domain-containing protein [bacterium]